MNTHVGVGQLLRCLHYDLHRGLRVAVLPLMLLVLVLAVMLAGIFREVQATSNVELCQMTTGDLMFALLAGKRVPEYRAGAVPVPPFAWLLLMMLVLLPTFSHSYSDLREIGFQSLLRCGSRAIWWLSKAIWTFLVTAVSWGAIWLSCIVAAQAAGLSLSFVVSEAGCRVVGASLVVGVPLTTAIQLWVAAFAAMEALSLIQCAISTLVQPVAGYALMCAQLFVAYFVQTPLLPANACMLIRSGIFLDGGISFAGGLACSVGLSLAGIILGGLAFSRVDLLSGEE